MNCFTTVKIRRALLAQEGPEGDVQAAIYKIERGDLQAGLALGLRADQINKMLPSRLTIPAA